MRIVKDSGIRELVPTAITIAKALIPESVPEPLRGEFVAALAGRLTADAVENRIREEER